MVDVPDDFIRELGIFIMEFASTESFLLAALTDTAAVSHDTARAVFSGVKIDTAKSMINRLRAVKGLPEDPILKRAFEQLTVITAVRNDLVHYGPKFTFGQEIFATNEFIAMPGRKRSAAISATALRAMCNDLSIIKCAIALVLLPVADEIKQNAGLHENAQRAWRYIPQ